MKTILGIDIGGTTTKIVGLDQTGTLLSTLRVQAEEPLTSLYGAFGSYLSGNRLTLADVERVVLTGVGASYVEGDIYGLPTCTVDEFSASGTGALAMSGQEKAVVATMGTGTAFLWAERGKGVRHLCGSGIGGGTLGGLCRKLVDMERFGQIKKLAEQGDRRQFRQPLGGRRPRRPGRRGGEPGASGHRHHDGAGLPVLRDGHGGPHRLRHHAVPGKAQL